MRKPLTVAIKHWEHVAPVVKYPRNQREFDALVSQLDDLLEIVGQDEKHTLIGLIDVMSQLVAAYEEEHDPAPAMNGVAALKFLIESNQLNQSDLSEVASQGVMSEILSGKRALNLRQIKLLAKRFHVDPSTFIE